jgi:hypothetical protein
LPVARARVILSFTLVLCAMGATVGAADAPSRVRSTSRAIVQLVSEGVQRSATLRALVDDIEHSDGIVYVEFGVCAFGHVNGCVLPFVLPAQGQRYLRIVVTSDANRVRHDRLLSLIGHELQHAREILEHPEVVDVMTMERMYRQIGRPLTGQSGYETSAARAAGDAILAELFNKRAVSHQDAPVRPDALFSDYGFGVPATADLATVRFLDVQTGHRAHVDRRWRLHRVGASRPCYDGGE